MATREPGGDGTGAAGGGGAFLRAIDLPPVWLAGFAALAWLVGRVWPLALPGAIDHTLGYPMIAGGVALMLAAVYEMRRKRTTIMPRQAPGALVTGGIFRLSRNPIYLGDALVLAGLIFVWDALLALPLVAAFVLLVSHRFIRGEEAMLRSHFGAEFDRFALRTRRWF